MLRKHDVTPLPPHQPCPLSLSLSEPQQQQPATSDRIGSARCGTIRSISLVACVFRSDHPMRPRRRFMWSGACRWDEGWRERRRRSTCSRTSASALTLWPRTKRPHHSGIITALTQLVHLRCDSQAHTTASSRSTTATHSRHFAHPLSSQRPFLIPRVPSPWPASITRAAPLRRPTVARMF